LHPSFTPKAEVRKVPVVSGISEGIQSLYMERSGSDEAKDRLV